MENGGQVRVPAIGIVTSMGSGDGPTVSRAPLCLLAIAADPDSAAEAVARETAAGVEGVRLCFPPAVESPRRPASRPDRNGSAPGAMDAPGPSVEWLRECELLLVPEFELRWLPLVVSAMALGLPVVMPDSPAVREALGPGDWSVPGEDAAALAARIELLRHDPAERETVVRRGQAVARRQRNREHLPPSLRRPFPGKQAWPVPQSAPPYPEYRRLSVVIACHGKRALTEQCVRSLAADVPDAEVLLVDNASPDGTAAWARRRGLRVLSFPENRGVAPAWNAGLRAAHGDLLCVLNNDTVVQPGGMRRLAEAAWQVGIAAFRGGVLDEQLSCVRLTPVAGESDYADGCALLFRRDVLERVGEFDEGMELAYCEDSDWSLRARSLGYGWAVVPDALVHMGSETSRHVRGVAEHHRRNQERLRLRWGGKGAGERIKVRRWGMLGDVLMLTPALAGLRREKPLARIHLQCPPEIAGLLQGWEAVDLVDPEEIAGYTATFDLDFATWSLEQAGHWRHPAFAFADALGVALRPERYYVPPTPELEEWAESLLPGTGYVACGLRSERREKANWSESAWRELCRELPDRRFVLFDRASQPSLEARGEAYFGPRLYDLPNVVDLTGETPTLRHLLALLRRCSAAVAVDSGIFHLASAAGLPVVALMGGAPGWARQPLAGVQRILQGEAPCYPCSDPWECHRGDGGPHCLEWLTGRRVALALRGLLD